MFFKEFQNYNFILQATIANWRKVWYVTFALMFTETLFYLGFASGEEQPWNKTFEDQPIIESLSDKQEVELEKSHKS